MAAVEVKYSYEHEREGSKQDKISRGVGEWKVLVHMYIPDGNGYVSRARKK